MADSHGPRPPLEPRTDHVEPTYTIRSGKAPLCFLDEGEKHFGIHHWFILDAYLVVAGKGFLSSTPKSTGRVDLDENGFLTAQSTRCGIYEYLADGGDDLNVGPGARPIDDVRQILTLEFGLQERMDRPSFVTAPSPPGDKYVCYFFAKWRIGLAEDYHMRTANIPSRNQGYALFARFAWAMIQVALSLPSCETPVKKEDYDAEDGPDRSAASKRRTIGGTHTIDGVAGPSSTGGSWVEANIENIDAGFDVQTDSHSDANYHSDDSFSNTHDECSEHDSPSVNPFREQEWEMTPSQIQRFK
ncbi:hypothetical protein ARMGADRAFT_1165379 [Armillaria gallica]|uniref:HNH nuclease domain-containing protein n=1 Tax=Armillaria gallica TaxID=47427 RepID=A0A2H3DD30_ARMGA|nr:hypothetical protein ARMGADRAFT_1165379 [Armillaria gallica]